MTPRRRVSMMGKNNPKWKGGMSQYPDHGLMKMNRELILSLVHGQCERCGLPAEVIHHLDGSYDNHDIANLEALCLKCHLAIHKKPKDHRNYFINTVKHHLLQERRKNAKGNRT